MGAWEGVRDLAAAIFDLSKGAIGLAVSEHDRAMFGETTNFMWQHPSEAGTAIWEGVTEPYTEAWANEEYGKAFGRVAPEIVLMVVGTKGLGNLGKLARGAKATDIVGDAGRVVRGVSFTQR